jgi:hypothetical protein
MSKGHRKHANTVATKQTQVPNVELVITQDSRKNPSGPLFYTNGIFEVIHTKDKFILLSM